MTFNTKRHTSSSTRTQWLLRYGGHLFLSVAFLTLGYVGFILFDARLYQAKANRSLEVQVQAQQEHRVSPVSQPQPVIEVRDVLGRIEIPRLGMSVAVLQGTSSRVLRRGAGHVEGTALPGEQGNSVIAGHRDTFFRELKDIRQKDEIQLQTATGLFRYEVDWVKVVEPDDLSVLAPSTESALTLVTCYPFQFLGSAPKRFAVHAQKQ
jgi:sortase A